MSGSIFSQSLGQETFTGGFNLDSPVSISAGVKTSSGKLGDRTLILSTPGSEITLTGSWAEIDFLAPPMTMSARVQLLRPTENRPPQPRPAAPPVALRAPSASAEA